MDDRQRFIAALTFRKADRIPFEPGWPRESTLRAWKQQGLPEEGDWHIHLLSILGIECKPPEKPGLDLGVDFKMIPTFEEKVLEHRDGHYIVQDWMGAITEISDKYDYTYIRTAKDFVTRKWHRFPVQDRRDWLEKVQWRYSLDAAGRYPLDFTQRCQALWEHDDPLKLSFNGPFWQLREWCGMEGLCLLMAEQPEFVKEMIAFWGEFILDMLEVILEQVALDYVMVNEDMAYKLHSMISPQMVRRFLLPTWQAWTDLLKKYGCPVICVDSDGYIAELLPLFIEAGFNCTFPVEVAAGNDIVAYRQIYGDQMAYLGGIDKRALAAGGEAMRAEVLRVVPPLFERGGFIPGCDHGVPPDIAWPDFIAYARLIAQLTGWL
jgi:uroporphyrinogen decarboxylase